MISVIIPTYRRAELCLRAITSVTSQTVKDIEIIVVDDASHDGSIETIKNKIIDSRVQIVSLPVNSGGGVARNCGVRQATGDLIAFLDSDDWWATDKLERQLACMEQIEDKASHWLMCNAVVFEPEPNYTVKPSRWLENDEDLSDFLIVERQYLQTSGFLLPRKTALKFPFDESLRRHQDWDLLLRIRSHGTSLHHCSADTVFYGSDDTGFRVGQMTTTEPTIHWLQTRSGLLSRKAKAELNFLIAKTMLKARRTGSIWFFGRSVVAHPSIIRRMAANFLVWLRNMTRS